MTELTHDDILAQLQSEFAAKIVAVEETKKRYQAEMAEHAKLLEVEQRRIERAAEKREAQEALDVYLIAWRQKLAEQADAAAAWVAKMTEYVEILKRAGSGQQFIQSQAQATLVDFASGLKAFVKAFDSEAEMKQAAYGLAEQLTAGISWNLPASVPLRTEFGIRNADWRNQFGDLRKQAIDKGLKAQPAQPAPATIQAATPESTEPNDPTAPTRPAPQRRQKRR